MNKVLNLAFKPTDWLLQWPDKENMFLEGVYAPVQEEVSRECEVVGTIPEAVYGEYARNGPNPRFTPAGGYHWFDGDGMVHAVRIKAGKVTYSNRFVRTKRLRAEEEVGKPLALKLGDMASKVAIPKLVSYSLKKKLGVITDFEKELESTNNTSLEYHAGRLLALGEGGIPYGLRVLCDGVIETIGRESFDGEMKTAFTAHPKRDPTTGKLYGFSHMADPSPKPFLTFYVLDAQGKIERQFPVELGRSSLMHDFAITENHVVFLDNPLVVKGEMFLKGKMPIVYDNTQESRIGILPIDAQDGSSVRWIDIPQTYLAFHVLNAWEERVEVEGSSAFAALKLITCDFAEFKLNLQEIMEDASDGSMAQPHMCTVNLDSGTVTKACMVPMPLKEGLDFPQLRRSLVGRRNRFGYFSGFDRHGKSRSLVKMDLQAASPETAIVGRIFLGDWQGGECLFIPSKPDDDDGGKEDDGYLVTFVTPFDGSNSELRVWDAKTMNENPVATIKIPARVPAGFHALFVSEADLALQQ